MQEWLEPLFKLAVSMVLGFTIGTLTFRLLSPFQRCKRMGHDIPHTEIGQSLWCDRCFRLVDNPNYVPVIDLIRRRVENRVENNPIYFFDQIYNFQPTGWNPPVNNEADQKALDLLRENLTAEQRKSLDDRGYFTVVGSRGRRKYHIGAWTYSYNIMDEDGVFYCAYPNYIFDSYARPYRMPTCDKVLAQKLLITSNESEFVRTANVSGGPHHHPAVKWELGEA